MDLKKSLEDFNNKLRKHLSNELLYLTEKKAEYDNQIVQLTIEREQKNKTLFSHIDNTDARKYFSPLNLNDMEHDIADGKEKEISSHIDQIQKNITSIENCLQDINDLEIELDNIISKL